jgi:hypothetical protein
MAPTVVIIPAPKLAKDPYKMMVCVSISVRIAKKYSHGYIY